MWRLFQIALFVCGLILALFGIVADVLLPWASPGLNLPQLFVIGLGLLLALQPILWRWAKTIWLGAGERSRRIFTAALITAVTLVSLELVIWLAGFRPAYTMAQPHHRLVKAAWQTCDEAGCHYVYDAALRACKRGVLKERVCTINRQGYADSDDFTSDGDYENWPRILLLGDSFTFGMSADPGLSFADFLDADFPNAVIWNLAHPGSGTHNAIAAFSVYSQILKPNLTILGFYNNDYDDNLMPVDTWLNAIGPDGEASVLRRSYVDDHEKVITYEIEDMEYWLSFSRYPPKSEIEHMLGSTQLGTLLLRLAGPNESLLPADTRFERRREVTQGLLRELRDDVAAQGAAFLALLIPHPDDLGTPSMRYQLTQDIMTDVDIPYLNPANILDPVSDYAPPPDFHWSNAGHQKVGALLSDCVQRYFDSGGLANCEHVIIF